MTRGRPRLDPIAPSATVTFRLSVKQLADLQQQATRARVSLAELIRRKIDAPRPPGISNHKN